MCTVNLSSYLNKLHLYYCNTLLDGWLHNTFIAFSISFSHSILDCFIKHDNIHWTYQNKGPVVSIAVFCLKPATWSCHISIFNEYLIMTTSNVTLLYKHTILPVYYNSPNWSIHHIWVEHWIKLIYEPISRCNRVGEHSG